MMRIINDIRDLTRALYNGQDLSVYHVAQLVDSGKEHCSKLRDELQKALAEEQEIALVSK